MLGGVIRRRPLPSSLTTKMPVGCSFLSLRRKTSRLPSGEKSRIVFTSWVRGNLPHAASVGGADRPDSCLAGVGQPEVPTGKQSPVRRPSEAAVLFDLIRIGCRELAEAAGVGVDDLGGRRMVPRIGATEDRDFGAVGRPMRPLLSPSPTTTSATRASAASSRPRITEPSSLN